MNYDPSSEKAQPSADFDLVQAQTFCNLLSGNKPEAFLFATYPEARDPNGGAKKTPQGDLRERYATLSEAVSYLQSRQNDNFGAWINVQKINPEKRVDALRVIVAELSLEPTMDAFSVADGGFWPLRPSIKVQTAPNEFHYYWIVANPEGLSASEYEAIAERLVAQYGALRETLDPLRVRRFPGTWNRKPEIPFPFQVQLQNDDGAIYDKGALVTAFPPLNDEERATAKIPEYGDGNASKYLEAIHRIDPLVGNNAETVGRALYFEGAGGKKAQFMWVTWLHDSQKEAFGPRWSTFHRQVGEHRITGAEILLLSSAQADKVSGELTNPDIQFAQDKDRRVEKTIENLQLYLNAMGVTLKKNLFSGKPEIHRKGAVHPFTDDELLILRQDAETRGFKMAKEDFIDKLRYLAIKNQYHPVRDYLSALQWDGIPRIDTWMMVAGGVYDNALHRQFCRKVLIAAVRRVRKPGCKFDSVLILEGPQGYGKSGLVEVMATTPWFSSSLHIGADAKRTAEHTQGKWIIESAELIGMTPKKVEEIKNWVTTTSDRARLSYKEFDEDFPRQFICVGTTNSNNYLTDATGNRRFWPVQITKMVNFKWLKENRDQLWAEAALYEAKGESLELPAEMRSVALKAADERVFENPIEDEIATILGDAQHGIVWMQDVCHVLGITGTMKQGWRLKEIKNAFEKRGFKSTKLRKTSGRQTNPTSCFVKNDQFGNAKPITLQPLHEMPSFSSASASETLMNGVTTGEAGMQH